MDDKEKNAALLAEAKAAEDDRTVYVVHPVSPELKKQITSEGGIILDAKFAPKGAQVFNPHEKKKAEPKEPIKGGGKPPAKPPAGGDT